MIKNEYIRFMQTLGNEQPEGVRKLANIVLDNLETLQPLGTAAGKRANKIVELAQQHWATISDEITTSSTESTASSQSIQRLKSLKVGPFRGFSKEEVFELDSQLVLIYGPNGTGKSSFCEALEYGLLGSVAEADAKRLGSQNYLKNAHVNRFVAPVIQVVNNEGHQTPITANEALFRYCFVEKNRIDNFSRIAAHAPSKQTELISSLFGLDSFNEFVKNFSRELDNRYIDLVGKKTQELAQKHQTLTGAHQTVKSNTESLKTLSLKENELANKYKQGMSFVELIRALGSTESPGVIATLEKELQKPVNTKSGLTVAQLQSHKDKIEKQIEDLTTKDAELAASSKDLSFQQLYSAVSALGVENRNECPACKTPVTQTRVNPFEYANSALSKLAHLSKLEKERQQLAQTLLASINVIYQILSVAVRNFSNNPLAAWALSPGTQADINWWNSLFVVDQGGITAWANLDLQVKHLEQADKEIASAELSRQDKQKLLAQLREYEKQVTIFKTQRATLDDGLKKAQQAICSFNEENKEFIKQVEREKVTIATNKVISTSYALFIELLTNHKENLPATLVADLGDKVVELYNAFNRHDPPKDLLSEIKLPLNAGQQIQVSFQTAPEHFFDALHILSEGHIRCIGLAILLAKNLKENCPLLIFDDPVNAIDDEHRSAIKHTLFKEEFFKDTQIILAIHGQEFFKDIHQLVGKEVAQNSESYTFKPQRNENHIQVQSLQRPINYVHAAVDLKNQGDYRDALMSSRRGFEDICTKTWSYYLKHGGKPISVTMRYPNAPIDLRSLAEKLKSEINKDKYQIPAKDIITTALETVLGANGEHKHWVYLNKGTHEESDRTEFDHVTVSEIVDSLASIDSIVN